jgi:broad specificity phosphatase PhoE
MTSLLLVRHGTTAETRRAVFSATPGASSAEAGPELDTAGVAQARALGPAVARAERCWSSWAARARQTAAEASLEPQPWGELAEMGFGEWAGARPHDDALVDRELLAAWHADPDTAPPRGEGLAAVRARARTVLERAVALGGTTVAVTHGGFVKAAVVEVLGLPASGVWSLEVAPGSVTELCHDGHWRMAVLNAVPSPASVSAGAADPEGAA